LIESQRTHLPLAEESGEEKDKPEHAVVDQLVEMYDGRGMILHVKLPKRMGKLLVEMFKAPDAPAQPADENHDFGYHSFDGPRRNSQS
jgi:hypothetical protein